MRNYVTALVKKSFPTITNSGKNVNADVLNEKLKKFVVVTYDTKRSEIVETDDIVKALIQLCFPKTFKVFFEKEDNKVHELLYAFSIQKLKNFT
jgi:hypothetical protein